ncbi:Gar1/Naf1 RNA binding region-domain-containing protein [Helicostylum pulchrum]|nr:Gar1/Naf1 RNA binding region-domain-containing protein [Helicostylum pulchrum]
MSIGRGGGRGGFGGGGFNQGPPSEVVVVGTFVSACEGEMVCKLNNPKVPFFNAPIYLQDKTLIGKIDEILGPLNEIFFTVKMESGVTATTFKPDDKVYIGLDKLLPMERFLPKPKVAGKAKCWLQCSRWPWWSRWIWWRPWRTRRTWWIRW